MKQPAKHHSGKTENDDAELFRSAVGEVNPLADQNRITPEPARRFSVQRAVAAPAEIADTLTDFTDAETPGEYLGNGLSRMTLRKLRRGVWPVQDSLDLHGYHKDEARRLLQAFLYQAMQRELRCVLVIHGKGMNSRGGEAVLRGLARHWLMQLPNVLALCDAPAREGGSGAALVLLKIKL